MSGLLKACNGGGDAPIDLTENLVAHYLLNNNADDSHGTYDGTSVGGVDFQGDVTDFTNVDAHRITLPTIVGIKTLSMWYSFHSHNDFNTVLSVPIQSYEKTQLIAWGVGVAFRFYITNLVWFDLVADVGTIPLDTQFNLTVTTDGTTYSFYTDGVLLGTVASTEPIVIDGFGFHEASTRGHNGTISNVRIYSEAKEQAFIDDLYAEGYYPKPLPLSTTVGLVAHYPLTGTAEDSTGTYDSTEVSATYKDDAEFGSVYDGGGSITVNTSATALANWCCYWLESGSGWTFTKTTTIPSSLTTNDYRNLRLYSATPSTALQDEIEAYEKNFRPIDIDDGLVAYYPLANNSLDNYYNEYDGVDSAGVTYDGVKASYSSLNRTSLGLNTLPHLTQYTFSFWALRLSAVTDTNLVFTLYRRWSSTSSYRSGIAIEILDSGTLRFFIHNSTDNYSSSTSISVDTLHHVAITYDNGTVEMFIDNQKVYSAYMAVVGWSSAGPSDDSIGGYITQVGQTYSYTGDISKFRIYDKAITAEQVEVIYNTEKGDFI